MENKEKNTFLSHLKEVTFFIAIYLYFMGFIYIYYFYEEFGIPLRVLDTPVYFFFVYSYNVIQNISEVDWSQILFAHRLWALVIIFYVCLLIAMANGWQRSRRAIFFISLVGVLPFIPVVALEAAKVDAGRFREGSQGTREITFLLKADSADLRVLKRLHSSIKDKELTGKTKPASGADSDTEDHRKIKETNELLSPAELSDFTRFIETNGRADIESKEGLQLPKFYLITETSDAFYVLAQARSEETRVKGFVYEVPKDIVVLSSVRIAY